MALIDSGNKVRYPIIISGKFADKLKLKIYPTPPELKIGTAATTGVLKVRGIGSPMSVFLDQSFGASGPAASCEHRFCLLNQSEVNLGFQRINPKGY